MSEPVSICDNCGKVQQSHREVYGELVCYPDTFPHAPMIFSGPEVILGNTPQQARIAELEAENTRLRDALQGLWARHNDGSEEHLWAEWDTAQDLLQSQDGK
jgi:hypothetical protein